MKKTIIILGAIMFILPLLLIGYVSYLEMQEYKPEAEYKIVEKAYGDPRQVFRQSVSESFELSGTITSKSYVFVNAENNDSKTVRTYVSTGDEVKVGDVLALIGDTEIVSSVNGIVSDMSLYGKDGFVKLLDLDSLVFECSVDEGRLLEVGDTFETEVGATLELFSLSNMTDSSGRRAVFSVTGAQFLYGAAKTFKVYTGTVYNNVLVVHRKCVYQKEIGGPYYIRRVDESGLVIGEVEVDVGISNGTLITITGAEEGWYCDSGYAQFVGLQRS